MKMIMRAVMRRKVKSDGDNHEDDDDQPKRFEDGRSLDPAGEWHDLCFNKLRKNSGPFQSQTLLKLQVFSIDSF